MEISREAISGLVPDGFPPEGLTSPQVRALAQTLEGEPVLQRSFLWASAVITAGFQSTTPLESGFTHFSAGFVWAASELSSVTGPRARSASGFVFGGSVVVRSATAPQRIVPLEVAGLTIPIVVIRGGYEAHGCPPHPSSGSSTCWAKSTQPGATWTRAILTCRHINAALSVGTRISLTPSAAHATPGSATLADIDECTIDASLMEVTGSSWPKGLSRMSVQRPAAPGQAVFFEDRSGKRRSGTVLRIFHFNTYAGNLFGQRVVADCCGAAGDSGSLLLLSQSKRGVGIYMGTIPDGAGGRDGMFQDLAQVEDYFGLELYH